MAAQIGDPSPLSGFAAGVAGVSFGVTASGAPAAIIAANENGISLYNIHERRCVHSWSTRPGLSFCSPIVQHQSSKRFFSVQEGGRMLSTWTFDTVEFDKAQNQATDEAVVALTTAAQALNDDALVIFASGRVGCWSIADRRIYVIGEPSSPVASTVCASAVVESDEATIRVAILFVSGVLLQYVLPVARGGIVSAESSTLQFPGGPSETVLAADFHGETLVVFSSAGHLCRFSVSSPVPQTMLSLRMDAFASLESSSSSAATSATPRKQARAKATPAAASAARANVAVVALPGSHALVSYRTGGADFAALWDLQFGTLQSESSLPSVDGASSLTALPIRASFANDMALIGTAYGVAHLVPVTCPPAATLLGALGRLKQTLPHLDKAEVASLRAGGDPAVDDEDAVLKRLAASASPRAFGEIFFAFVEKQAAAAAAASAAAGVPEPAAPAPGKRRMTPSQSQRFIHEVLQMSLSSPQHFAEDVLAHLIQSHAVSATLEDNLIPALIERQNFRLLDCCLMCVHDIPESQLLHILQHGLSGAADDELAKYAAAREAETGLPAALEGDAARDAFLYLVLSAPRNDVFMDAYLRNLDYKQSLFLLRLLHSLLKKHLASLDTSLRAATCQRIPSLAQTIDWLCMVLDAHFARIVLSPTAHEVFADLRKLTHEHLDVCTAVESLQGQLSGVMQLLLRQRSAPAVARDYSIERIVM